MRLQFASRWLLFIMVFAACQQTEKPVDTSMTASKSIEADLAAIRQVFQQQLFIKMYGFFGEMIKVHGRW